MDGNDGTRTLEASPRLKLLDMKQLTELTGLSQRYIELRIKENKFPRPIPFGRRRRWLANTIIKHLEARDRKAGNR